MDGAGAPAQPVDAEMTEAQPEAQQHPAMGMENIPATLSHGGRFIQYNIFGNIFEVTAKYKPPIMPIGKGAYGIVWSLSLLSLSLSLARSLALFLLWISQRSYISFFFF
jgi:mitogen-activated protein kinase 6